MKLRIITGLLLALIAALPCHAMHRARRIMGHLVPASVAVAARVAPQPVSAAIAVDAEQEAKIKADVDALLDDLTSDVHPLLKAYYENDIEAFKKLVVSSSAHVAQDLATIKKKHDIDLYTLTKKDKKSDFTKILVESYGALGLACIAMDKGDFAQVKKLIATNTCDLNVPFIDGETLLYKAICGGDDSRLAMVEYLIAQGAEVNVANDNGYTPLMEAVRYESLEIVKYLVARGANINAKNAYNWTALEYARIYPKNFEILKYLICVNLDSSATDEYELLKTAIARENLQLTQLLVSAGLDVNRKDPKTGEPILMTAVRHGGLKIVAYLVEQGADINASNDDLKTVLMEAVYGSLEIVKYLVARGADINAKTRDNRTALDYAMMHRDLGILKYLICVNLDSSATDEYELLRAAVRRGNLRAIQLLVSLGLDVNRKDKDTDGETILMHAIRWGDLKVIAYLVEQGADINASNDDLKTVLMEAVRYEYLEVVRYLVARGADINAKTRDNKNAFYYARKPEILKYLICVNLDSSATDEYELLNEAIYRGDLKLVQLLVSAGLDVNKKDTAGGTILMKAVYYKHLEIVKYLIAQGAKVNAARNNGETILMEAVCYGDLEIVKYLVEHGANIAAHDKYGRTALMFAANSSKQEIREYLKSCCIVLQRKKAQERAQKVNHVIRRHLLLHSAL